MRAVAVYAAAATVLTGCAPWLAANPRFATDSASNPDPSPTTTVASGEPPAIAAPKNDLSWTDCTSALFGGAGTRLRPA